MFIHYLFFESLSRDSVLDTPSDRLDDGLGLKLCFAQGLGSVKLQLQRHVSQDVQFQCGQWGLQVRCAHVALGQPVDQRLGHLPLLLSWPTTAKEQNLQLLPHLRGHLGCDLGRRSTDMMEKQNSKETVRLKYTRSMLSALVTVSRRLSSCSHLPLHPTTPCRSPLILLSSNSSLCTSASRASWSSWFTPALSERQNLHVSCHSLEEVALQNIFKKRKECDNVSGCWYLIGAVGAAAMTTSFSFSSLSCSNCCCFCCTSYNTSRISIADDNKDNTKEKAPLS